MRSATAELPRSRATGMAISTVRKGRDEVRAGTRPEALVKVRRSGGGRPAHDSAHPELWPALERLIAPMTRGDPESPLRWTCKSTHTLSAEIFAQYGIRVCDKTIARLLRQTATVFRQRASRSRALNIPIATRSSSTSMPRPKTALIAAFRSSPSIPRRRNWLATSRTRDRSGSRAASPSWSTSMTSPTRRSARRSLTVCTMSPPMTAS